MQEKIRKHPAKMTTCPDKNCRDKSQYVAVAPTGSNRLHPNAMSTLEFLDEQLYQRALAGRYQREFDLVRRRLRSLKPFRGPNDFMKALWNNKPLREKITARLKELWIADYEFRQNSGLVLMLAMWHNVIGSGEDYWSDLFIGLAENVTATRDYLQTRITR